MAQIVPGNVLGGYRLVEQLGSGGMGEVWKAQNIRVERMERAVKVIRVDVAEREEYRARFLREAEVLEQLQHPNILHVFDLGEQDGVLFLTMELLRGKSLDVVMRDGPMAFERIIDVGGQALLGVAHAHTVGIVHRDLKPANLFLQNDGVVKVLDFGIARGGAGTGSLTGTGLAPGSPAYFAPEFADGAPATAASDVYAMGIALFQMTTGRLPFEGGGSTPSQASISLLIQHATKPFPDPRTLREGVPAILVDAIARATAKKPEQRPTALELAALLTGKTVSIPKPLAVSVPAKAGAAKAPVAVKGASTTLSPGIPVETPRRRGVWAFAGIAVLAAAAVPVGIHFLGASAPTPTPAASPVAIVSVAAPVASPITTLASVLVSPTATPAIEAPTATPRVVAVRPTPTPHAAGTHTAPVPTATKAAAIPTPTKVAVIATPSAVAGTGYFSVYADPWCEVSVDGKRVAEETPLKRYKLSSGKHSVRFDNPDKTFQFHKDYTIDVPADGEVKIYVDVKANAIKPM